MTTTGVRLVRAGRDERRDRARRYKIVVDGTTAGDIGAGDKMVVPLSPGQHTVRLKLDWLGSEPVTVLLNEGQVVSLACRPNGSSGPALLDILRGSAVLSALASSSRSNAGAAAVRALQVASDRPLPSLTTRR